MDPNDPLVNTATEYMYQMAVVSYHIMHGIQTVVLDEAVTAESGEVFPAGEYEFEVDGRYWTDFDRSNPIEAAAREQAWTGTAHGLIAELGVGTVTHSTLQLGLALAGLFAGLGLVFLVAGGGLVWAGRGKDTIIPDTVPESFVTERIEERSPRSDRQPIRQPRVGPLRRAHSDVFGCCAVCVGRLGCCPCCLRRVMTPVWGR